MLKNNKFKVKLVFLLVISFSENCYTDLCQAQEFLPGGGVLWSFFFCKFYFVYLISLNVQGDATDPRMNCVTLMYFGMEHFYLV